MAMFTNKFLPNGFRKKSFWLAISSIYFFGGCTSIDLHSSQTKAQTELVQQAEQQSLTSSSSSLYSHQPLPDHWWQLYGDAQLNQFVDTALLHNKELNVALANLEQAQAKVDEAAGGQMPSVIVNGSPTYGHASGLSMLSPGATPPNGYHYNLGAGISYQVDVFGQITKGIEAAQANSEAVSAALDLVRMNVAASTTRAYAEICAANMEIGTAQHSLALQSEAVRVNEALVKAGRVGQIDVDRAKTQYSQLQAAVPPLIAQKQSALYQLATLTGQLPQQLSDHSVTCHQPLALTQIIPVGDGVQLLRRRPDIRQAERKLVEAGANVDVVTADLYPKITLGLSASSAGTMSGFANRDTFGWSLGPLISWTLPNTGVVRARINQAKASEKMALARFDNTVLTALREVETGLSNYAQALDRHKSLQTTRDQAAKVAEQARILYQGGRTNYLDNLDAERNLATTELALATSHAELMQDQIALFLALGGGWQP